MPPPIRPATGALQHRPVGNYYNHPRPQQAQQARAVLPTTEATAEINDDVDAYHCLNMTQETNVLRLMKTRRNYKSRKSLENAVLLLSYHYHNNIDQHDPQEILAAMKKLDKLRQKDMLSVPSRNYLLCNYEKLWRPVGLLLTDPTRVLLLLVSYVQDS